MLLEVIFDYVIMLFVTYLQLDVFFLEKNYVSKLFFLLSRCHTDVIIRQVTSDGIV
jgi:hypothetical protein